MLGNYSIDYIRALNFHKILNQAQYWSQNKLFVSQKKKVNSKRDIYPTTPTNYFACISKTTIDHP
ncbi:unnamed protein product [Meloidogyne enterolobii]|uniref:Uncharacterized protein n=1 Tax=Meloidogyne enterolobii TaxID=390850 RepID=A0ACB0YQ34_MELEN